MKPPVAGLVTAAVLAVTLGLAGCGSTPSAAVPGTGSGVAPAASESSSIVVDAKARTLVASTN